MERESVLEAIYEDDPLDKEDFLSDVDMVDAPSEDGELKQCAISGLQNPQFTFRNGVSFHPNAPDNDLEKVIRTSKHRNRKKKKSKKRRNGDNSIGNINRFVINTCRHLREPKSYLVWEAIRKLGVSAVRNFVEEVVSIESRGGQMTADGKRRRTPGGILWNILKSREAEAYKEIMLKGKEFEKQLRKENSKWRAAELGEQPNSKRYKMGSGESCRKNGDQTTESTFSNFSEPCKENGQPEISLEENFPETSLEENSGQRSLIKAWVDGIRTNNAVCESSCRVDKIQQTRLSEKVKLPVRDRIRVPVGYDDLIVDDATDIECKREENGHVKDTI